MSDEITVEISVENHEETEQAERIIETYRDALEVVIRKNQNYGNSIENSALVEAQIMGEDLSDGEILKLICRQIFVRGLLDKLSRFYQLAFNNETDRVDESLDETTLDIGNYALLLTMLIRKYQEDDK